MTGTSAGYDQWVGGYPSPRWHTSNGDVSLVTLKFLMEYLRWLSEPQDKFSRSVADYHCLQ